MTEDRWQRVKTALEAVLAQKRGKRAEFLDRLCRNDPELRDEVRSLVEAYDDDFLEQPAAPLAVTALSKSPKPPRTIGPYRIVKKLGTGGMGEVYQVVDPHGNHFAVKRLVRPFAAPDELRRLKREARAEAALEHPNVVRFISLIEHRGDPVIVMEYLDGKTLSEILSQRRRLEVSMALGIALQIAKGLAGAHERGIVHRDIKPDNIVITRDGVAKILDFGIAKLLEALDQSGGHGERLTKTGDILGTAGYMSPEQARGTKVDVRADIFSFGCVLYRTISGRDAFRGDTALERRLALMRATPEPLSEALPSVPPELVAVVHRCLEKDPEKRYATGTELVAAMRQLARWL